MRFRIFTLLLVAIALGLQATSAGADTRSWSAPVTLTPHANESGGVTVSLAENGDAVSLWTIGYGVKGAARLAGVRPFVGGEAHPVVQAAIRPDGGSYGAVQTLSNPEAPAYAEGIATNAGGEAIAVWGQDLVGETTPGEKTELEYAIRPAGAGSFGAPKALTETGVPGGGASVAMNPAGEAVIAWSAAKETEIQYVTRPAGGAFGAISTIKAPVGVGVDDVYNAIDGHGDAVISWNADAETAEKLHTGKVEVIRRPGGGAFGTPADLSGAGVQDYSPRPAIDGSGNATLVWIVELENPETKKPAYKVQARTVSSAGTLGETQTLSAFGLLPEEPRIGVDGAGEATALWTRVGGSSVSDEADILATPGGKFEAPLLLDSSGGSFTSDAVAVSGSGEAMVLWAHVAGNEPPTEQLVEATRTPGGAFAPAVPVSGVEGGFYAPSLAIDDAGDAAASWFGFGESALFEQSSNFVVPPVPVISAPHGGEPTKTVTTGTLFTLSLRFAKPSLAKLRKGIPIKVTCTLTAPGTCSVHLLISAAAARKLGLHVAKHAKTVTIGTVTIVLTAPGAKTVSLKLNSSALRAVKRDRRPLGLQLSAAARSAGGATANARQLALSIR